MAVLKPRNRLVYFRVSEEEFQKVSDICQSEGARSLSDFARQVIQQRIENHTDTRIENKLEMIDTLLGQLEEKLRQLDLLLAAHDSRGGSGNGELRDNKERNAC